ncbi:MAG TPA: zinc ribbon domain-containing protein [Gemmatimonadales bacterium]|nr:zinc ribbon domain-containing protein [Gemmatimonadales bacterium]
MNAVFALAVGSILAAGAVWYVLIPIVRPLPEPVDAPDSWESGDDPDDDLRPRAVALRALKEIEFDRATGKLSDADYALLKSQYTNEALVAMREDEGKREEGRGKGSPTGSPNTAPTPVTLPSSPLPLPAVCPTHGPRPESDAVFCSTCGRRLNTAKGFCGKCGSPLETDARFCARCGNRVAA